MAAFDENRISIECEDNAEGVPGVVVYDDETFPICSQQLTASDGHGYSSVQPWHFYHYEYGDTTLDWNLPETDNNSLVSLQDEENEDDDWNHLQPDRNINNSNEGTNMGDVSDRQIDKYSNWEDESSAMEWESSETTRNVESQNSDEEEILMDVDHQE